MANFDFPAFSLGGLYPSNSDAHIMSNSKLDISAVNNSQRVTENPGEGWEVSYKFGVMYPQDARNVKNLLHKLRGHINTVNVLDTTYSHLGPWSGNLTTDGAGQYGLALNIKGAPANTLIAYGTDRFKLGNQVHELTEDAVADATGRCTLKLANEIRNLTSDNQSLITNVAALLITCRWQDPKQIRQFKGRARLYRNITLTFLEKR